MNRQRRAYLLATLTIVLWSTSATAFKLALRHLSPDQLLFLASTTACICLLTILVLTGRLRSLLDWPLREHARSVLLGFLNPFLYYLVLLRAYQLLPAQQAQPLNFTWPIVLTLLSTLLLGQPLRAVTIPAMGLSLAGVVLISTRGEPGSWQVAAPLGVALALASTLVWSLYWVLGVNDQRDPLQRLFLNFLYGSLLVTGWMTWTAAWPAMAGGGLGAAIYVGLFEMGITFAVWLKALQLSRTTAQISALIYLTPFLSLMVIHVVLKEDIHSSTLAGLGLIIAGILLQQYRRTGPSPAR